MTTGGIASDNMGFTDDVAKGCVVAGSEKSCPMVRYTCYSTFPLTRRYLFDDYRIRHGHESAPEATIEVESKNSLGYGILRTCR